MGAVLGSHLQPLSSLAIYRTWPAAHSILLLKLASILQGQSCMKYCWYGHAVHHSFIYLFMFLDTLMWKGGAKHNSGLPDGCIWQLLIEFCLCSYEFGKCTLLMWWIYMNLILKRILNCWVCFSMMFSGLLVFFKRLWCTPRNAGLFSIQRWV